VKPVLHHLIAQAPVKAVEAVEVCPSALSLSFALMHGHPPTGL